MSPVTGSTRHTLTGHTREVSALVVAPDGSWLASAGDDGEVRIWDPVTGAQARYDKRNLVPFGEWIESREAREIPERATTTSIECAAGALPRPGIVRMSPQIG